MATPLHNHSHKSAKDGLATPFEIAERCKELDFTSVAVTDHDLVSGHIEFYKTVSGAGLKPILGIETYQTPVSRLTPQHKALSQNINGRKWRADNYHLILLAMNNEGLRNLWRMNSEAHTTGFWHNGRVDWELLRRCNEGIIATSACGLSLLSQAVEGNPLVDSPEKILSNYLSIFGDRFYIELSTYSADWQRNTNVRLSKLADEWGVPVVYANDAHYAYPQQYELHELILCMQYNEKKSELEEPHHTPDLYIMGQEEVESRLYYLPQTKMEEAVDNSDVIASLCNVTLTGFQKHIPLFIPDKKYKNSKDMIIALAEEGYQKKIIDRGLDSEEYMKRYADELRVIFEAGLYDYLLMVRDIIVWAKQKKGFLVGPGRGSVGGSLIAWLIDIHELDPIRYGLIFERFFNIGRETSLPDIDVDFPTWSRDALKEYAVSKYGAEYCADISNHGDFKARAAIQSLGRVLEIPFNDTKAISKIIEAAIESGQQPSWEGEKGLWETQGDKLKPYKAKHPELFSYAEELYGRTQQYGVHASGYIISDEPLADVFPLRWNATEKKPVTQWDMRVAEDLGFMKMDFLGLRNLDTLMEYNSVLLEQKKEPVDFYDVLRMDEDGELPEELYETLDRGFTVGIFQIEDTQYVKELTKKVKPRSLEEIALVTALNRPGPIKSGAAARYVDGRNGKIHPPKHPLIGRVASESYNQIVYQEQFINLFRELGYTPVEADNIRAIVGKKKRAEMAKIKPDFLKRLKAHPDSKTIISIDFSPDEYLNKLAEEIWHDLEQFADYAFNKAHSVFYGLITLWTTYAKWLNPAEFYLGSIRTLVNVPDGKNEIPRYIREAKRMEIEVLPVDMNESKMDATIQDGAIRYGFREVKGIGYSAAKWLVEHRPFKSFNHMLEVAEDPANKVTLKNGVKTMVVNRGHIEKLRRLIELEGDELVLAEEELLGYSLSDKSAMILEEKADWIASHCSTLDDVSNPGSHRVAGIIVEIKERTTKQGKPYAWVTLENSGERADFTIWAEEMKRFDFLLRVRQAVVLTVVTKARGSSIIGMKALDKITESYE
jgi:DNA polymerase-3 subunit alpha